MAKNKWIYLSLLICSVNVAFGQFNEPITVASDTFYNAFPGLVQLKDGSLITFYGKGTSHAGTGMVQVRRKSNDLGKTWSNEILVRSDSTISMAGAQPSLLSNGDVLLAYSSLHGVDFCLSKDNCQTWGGPIKLNTSFNDFTAASARVIELSNGKLICGFYGQNASDKYSSAHIMISEDLGLTWKDETIMGDGQSDSISYQEPNIMQMTNGKLVAMIRTSDSRFYYSSSLNNGSSWSKPEKKFFGNGSPRLLKLSDESLLVFYRSSNPLYNGNIVMRKSNDEGITWTNDLIVDSVKATSNGMMYASPIELSPDLVAISYGIEFSASKSDVRFRVLNAKLYSTDDITLRINTPNIWPNPTAQSINIHLDLPEWTNVSYSVYDVFGKSVKQNIIISEKLWGNVMKVDVSDLLNGCYFIELKAGVHKVSYGKFMVIN